MKKKAPKKSNLTRETKINHAIDFIEELSWILSSNKYSKLNLKEFANYLRNDFVNRKEQNDINKIYSVSPNKEFLVGILPKLFQDLSIFFKNEDIADFTSEVLKIKISRVEKRSRYELIGLVVCEVSELDDNSLAELVKTLSQIIRDEGKLKIIAKEKKNKLTGFSWNKTIRRLTSNNGN